MRQNIFKTSYRSIIRQKSHAIINILGLSLGLAISLLIWVYVLYELSYDKHFEDHQQLFRVYNKVSAGSGEAQTMPTSIFKTAEFAAEELPEVEGFVRFNNFFGSSQVSFDDRTVYLNDIMLTDSTFFTLFSFDFLAGDPQNALTLPNSLVLTESAALLLFEDAEDAYGKMVKFNHQSYQVTGVFEDVPGNSHMHITGLTPHYEKAEGAKNSGYNWYTYLKIKPGSNLSELAKKLDDITEKRIIAQNPMFEGVNFLQESSLMNITDIHLSGKNMWEMKNNGNRQILIIFIVLALFILVVAVINFVNLATARSMLRSKEIGVKKVIGASKAGLIRQFMSESFVITLLAFLLAMVFAEVFSEFFSQYLGLTIHLSILLSLQGLLIILTMIVFTTLLAGLYPAFYLSSFEPVSSLKGENVKGRAGAGFRRVLVIFQFVITIVLVSSLGIAMAQLRHLQTYNMGINEEQILVVRKVSQKIAYSFKDVAAKLQTQSRVISVAGTNFLFGGPNRIDLITEEGVSVNKGVTADILTIDHNFLDVMEIEIAEGRNFYANSEQDAQGAFILNETAVKGLGFENPLQKRLDLFGRNGPLVGVAKDFHIKSLHSQIEPVVMIFANNGFSHLYIKITAGDIREAHSQITDVLNEVDPAYIPDMVFLDEAIQAFYEKEQTTSGLLTVGAILAIIIAMLGVYGLAAFSAERNIKEIGVRTVLGASVGNLMWVFNKESVLMVAIAFIIATPLSWWMTRNWLDSFLIRIEPGPLWFLIPAFLVFVMSSTIISLQIWITTKSNPVDSLRTE